MSTAVLIAKTLSITLALVGAGGIATLSAFDVPQYMSQPASRSLPSIRWMFSRGSHVFPTLAFLSTGGFAYLAVNARPTGQTIAGVLKLASNTPVVNRYIAAAALCISIGPFTQFFMLPTNFALIDMNKDKGGSRSVESAKHPDKEVSEYSDLSVPQASTRDSTTAEEDLQTRELLSRFAKLNTTRAVLLGAGGVLGLVNTIL